MTKDIIHHSFFKENTEETVFLLQILDISLEMRDYLASNNLNSPLVARFDALFKEYYKYSSKE